MKVATIVGAPPQFIKAAIVSHHLRNQAGVKEVLLHTGQHYNPELSQVFFDERPQESVSLYGDGRAAMAITTSLAPNF